MLMDHRVYAYDRGGRDRNRGASALVRMAAPAHPVATCAAFTCNAPRHSSYLSKSPTSFHRRRPVEHHLGPQVRRHPLDGLLDALAQLVPELARLEVSPDLLAVHPVRE